MTSDQAATTDKSTWDYDKWMKEDPNGFEAYSKSNPEEFKKVYLAKFPKAKI